MTLRWCDDDDDDEDDDDDDDNEATPQLAPPPKRFWSINVGSVEVNPTLKPNPAKL